MSPLLFMFNTAATCAVYLFLLRPWMHYTGVNYYNPFAQIVVKITQPVISPLRKIFPALGKMDTASFIVLYIIAVIKLLIIFYYRKLNIYIDFQSWQCFIFAPLVIIYSFGYSMFWFLLIRAILSWVGHGQSQLEIVLYQLTEPVVSPIRRIIPPIGNIDISFMIFMFGLTFANILFSNFFGIWWEILSL